MDRKYPPIAIVGVSAMFPGSTDNQGFWKDILAGKDLLTEVPETHWLIEDYYDSDPTAPDKVYCRRGGFLQPTGFAPMEFGVPPSSLPSTDSSQLLALIVAKRVLEDAMKGDLKRLKRERVSVVLGVASTTELTAHMAGRLQRPLWIRAMRNCGLPEGKVEEIDKRLSGFYVPWQESTFPGLLANVVSGRIANQMDLGGTNCVIDAACASSLAALSAGLNELYLHQADLVIAGGVDTLNDILMFMCFAKTTALSPSEDCRPFSDRADGTMLGEGLGMFALKRLEDAERDGDRVYAVIRGLGSSSDGYAKSIYAPRAEGQAVALRRAYENAGYSPETVELVEAHGTATKAGDLAEFEGLKMVFDGASNAQRQWCALGSVKSQIGHTKAAAGAASLFKAVMALHHKILPPTIKVDAPNPGLHLEESPFYLNTRSRPWIRNNDHPRRASVSSFGFGGTNFHVTLEEYTAAQNASKIRTLPSELVLFSAPDSETLVSRGRAHLSQAAELSSIARNSQMSFDPKERIRLAIVAADVETARRKMDQAAANIAKQADRSFALPDGVFYGCGEEPGKVAFLFPGQGSQYVDMGADAAMHFDGVRSLWDRAAAMPLASDAKLHDVVFPPPVFDDAERRAQNDRLTRTEWAQPAIGVMSAGLLSVIRSLGISATCVAGHSFGEITALFAAGALDEDSFVRVARTRGELMAQAPKMPGTMTAVAAPREVLRKLMDGWDLDVVMANCNSPNQTVLSGPTVAIEAAEQRLKDAGMTARRLNVSTAFHSHLVHDASRAFQEFLNKVQFNAPALTVFANTDAGPYPQTPEQIRERLGGQMASPVLFEQQIGAMYEQGVRTFLEVGPGAALTGLVEECLQGKEHLALSVDRRGKHGITALFEALGRLAVRGVPIAFDALWENTPVETAEPQKQKPAANFVIPIGGANHGKPYPAAAREEIPVPVPAPDPVSVPVPVPTQEVSSMTSQEHLAWLQAYQQIQQQTVEAQTAFQRMMTESHMAFLKTAELSLQQLTQHLNGQPALQHTEMPAPAAPAPTPMPAPVMAPRAPISAPMPQPIQPIAAAPAPIAPAPKPAPKIDMEQLLLEVVSEKTGYPVEMLDLSMVMESDLGIDSIKRVQILSAIQDRVPDLPEVETNQLAGLRTLGEILAYMKREGMKEEMAKAVGVAAGNGVKKNSKLETELAPQRYVLRVIPAPRTSFAMSGLRDGKLVITDDETGIAAALAAQLAARGIPASVVQAVPQDAAAVIFLGGLKPTDTVDSATAINKEAFAAAKAIALRFQESPGVFVTVQDSRGSIRSWLAGIGALAKTAQLEWPKSNVKTIDIDRNNRNAEMTAAAIAEELLAGGPEVEVVLSADGSRWTPRSVAADAGAQDPSIDDQSVIVATGGARGVTAASLVELAKQTRARFVLLGRSSLSAEPSCYEGIASTPELKRVALAEAQKRGQKPSPKDLDREINRITANREIRATLNAFAEAGATARYVAVDVRDGAAVAAALEPIRREWGPITGIVHGAGVLADALIAHKTPAQFNDVFSTKVDGLRALLQATAQDPLRAICLFSSVAARHGNPGQCDYAMANEILNKVAQDEAQRRGSGVKVKSINWGPWEAGMVTPELKRLFADRGVGLIPLAAGAKSFVEEIQSKHSSDVEVVIGSGLLPGADRDTTVEVVVNAAAQPHLASHLIQGVATLPVVQVIEWFVRLAQACAPTLTFKACRNVKVLKGVLLKGFNNDADERFAIRCYRVSNGSGLTMRLELKGTDGTRYYEADAEMVDRGESPSDRFFERSDLQLEGSPWTTTQLYSRERLFHGRDFQVIQTLHGISRSGIAAVVNGTGAMGWQGGPWRTDPAAMDGGLQLMLLWSAQYMDQQTLPLAIGEFTQYSEPPADMPLHCVVRTNQTSPLHASFDMVLTLPDESPVARLSDVQMYVVPNGTAQRQGN